MTIKMLIMLMLCIYVDTFSDKSFEYVVETYCNPNCGYKRCEPRGCD